MWVTHRVSISAKHALTNDPFQIATARLGDFEKDIGLVGTQYNTVISVFFVGYILTQVPTNMILNKMRPSIFLPVVMCCWAVVSASTGAVQNYTAGALYLFSSWYTKKELAVRISVLYAAGQMAGAFGGLLGSAIMGGMNGKLGIADWRWLFIIEGVIPIPVAFFTYLILPDYPATTKWLSDDERKLAVLRITEEAVEEDSRSEASAWEGLKMTFTDPALYMIWLMQLGLNTAASFTNFFPTIVGTLGYNQRDTLLLSSPPVGFIISATTLNVAARYTATFMMMSVYGSFGCILSWVSTTLPRPATKRAVSYAVVNAGSNLASIYASYFYPKTQGPQYWQANILNVAFSAMCIFLATTLHFYLRWRNRQLRRAGDEDLLAEGTREGTRSKSLGDKWQCHPVYQYTL
ncbi:major facilitator superfamily transporter [Colletotrichum sojae]|uniref:Major facilitator superfamily transporter n=1 Tax=Colletotrichum sojae TaxID=2175907 RepID=A0A8H6JJN9_9PEZI|nr:major facilitator superfamily transporter [Colletotrichum sojae]